MSVNTPQSVAISGDDSDENLINLVELLQAIDLNNPLAGLNASSIADGNGSRVKL